MFTCLENILTFKRYEKWKAGEKLGSNAHPCYIQIRIITNGVILMFKCISFANLGGSGGGGGKGCFKCGEEGHMSRDCPKGGSGGKGCFKCGEEGHMSRDCPKSGGGGGGKGCFKCGEEGHMSRDCPSGGKCHVAIEVNSVFIHVYSNSIVCSDTGFGIMVIG